MNDLKVAVFRFIELNPKVDVVALVKRYSNEYKDLRWHRKDVSNSPLAKKLEAGEFSRFKHRCD